MHGVGIAASWGTLSGYKSLHSYQQWMGVPLTLHPYKHELSCVLLILAVLTGLRWNLTVIFICVSLMTKDIGYLSDF